jgi:hypothetical protein
MSESFRVEPDGLYFAIYWGPTLICTEWSVREQAQHHADVLEALRRMDEAAAGRGDDLMAFLHLSAVWTVYRNAIRRGRE